MTTLYEISQQRDREEQRPYDPYTDGALAALKRAAEKARKRNIALLGSVVTYRDGQIVHDTEP
jgi:hypothetical protein